MTDSDLSNLPNHCTNNGCAWCTERRERRRQRSIDAMKSSGVASHWDRKIGAGDIFGYWPMHGVPSMRSDTKIRFMRDAHSGGPKHKKVGRSS